MRLQTDFHNELTLLQFYGSKLGVTVDHIPKCHPKIVGEGIEYMWALAKSFFHHSPIEQKKTKEKFRNLVREASSPLSMLNIESVCSCSKKARTYMQMYKAIRTVDLTDEMSSIKHIMYEDTVKLY